MPLIQPGAIDPVRRLREIISKCPDEFPSHSSSELAFVTDPELRASILLDLSEANQALSNGAWKAATVIAGAAIEAILLWKLKQQPSPPARVDESDLSSLIDAAAPFLRPETVTAAKLAKDFRNLIHPGRMMRLQQKCNRGTALTAVAALEHVIEDLK